MYRNMESLYYITVTNSVAGQSYFRNKFIENLEIRFVVTRAGGIEGRGSWMKAVTQQDLSVRSTRDIMYNITLLYATYESCWEETLRIMKRKKYFFLFLLYLYEMMDVH